MIDPHEKKAIFLHYKYYLLIITNKHTHYFQKARIDREDENIVVNLADQFRDSALEELDSMLEECSTLYQAVSIKTC